MELVSMSTNFNLNVGKPTDSLGNAFSTTGLPGGHTTPIYPSDKGNCLLFKRLAASCGSTLSNLVKTPKVRLPSGSTCLLTLSASELAKSTSAALMASIMLGCCTYCSHNASMPFFSDAG
eukprot:NODE_43_length_28809_cov_0.237200.p19 type:complete len:120 gc:universal NODE_43_length_28809_cov_0.237200:24316-24675(+)